jgi:hypothetical protein
MSSRTTSRSNKRKSQVLLSSDSEDVGSLGMIFDEHSKQELEKELKEAKKEIKELKNENEMSKAENEALKKKIEKLEQSKPSGSADKEEESSDDEDSVADANDPSGARIQELRAFRQANGHCKVPQRYTVNNLGRWVNNQRASRKRKKLSQERIDKLDSLGFDWGKDHEPPKAWETTFVEITEHKETFDSFNFAPSGALGKWSNMQRKEFKRAKHGKDSLLTVDQIKQLSSIGFKWKGSRKA